MRWKTRIAVFTAAAAAAVALLATPAGAQGLDAQPEDPWTTRLGETQAAEAHRERCLALQEEISREGGGWFDVAKFVVTYGTDDLLDDIAGLGGDGNSAKDQWKALDCERKLLIGNAALVPTERWFGDSASGVSSAGIPLTQYVMYVDDGSTHHLDRRAKAGVITWGWRVGVTAMRVAVWSVDWVASGRLTEILAPLPRQIASMLDTEIVGPLRLRWMAMTFLGMAVGLMVVRRRTADAAGTALFSIGALLIGGLLLANFDTYLHGSFYAKRTFNDVVMGVENPGGPIQGPVQSTDDLLVPSAEWDASSVTRPVIDATIHVPWQELNFGRELTEECEINIAWIAAVSGQGSDEHWVRRNIKECGGGQELDDFNRRPTMSRIFGVVLIGAGQVAVSLLLLSTAVTAMASEVLLAAAFALLPLAVAGAAFPGGRVIVQKWVEMLLKGLLGFAVALVFLRVFIVVLTAIAAADGLAMFEKFALFALLALAAWRARKMIPQAAQRVTGMLGGKVAAAGSGGGGGGGRFAAAAGGAAAGSLLGAAGSQYLGAGGMLSIARGARKSAQVARGGLTGAQGAASRVADAAGADGKAARLLRATKGGTGPQSGLVAAATGAAAAGAYRKWRGPEWAKNADEMRRRQSGGRLVAAGAQQLPGSQPDLTLPRPPQQPPGGQADGYTPTTPPPAPQQPPGGQADGEVV